MAAEDQKLEAIEEEIKVLKGEVRRTLVDLRALVMREDSPLNENSFGRRAALNDLLPGDETPSARRESTETVRQEANERPVVATAPPPPPQQDSAANSGPGWGSMPPASGFPPAMGPSPANVWGGAPNYPSGPPSIASPATALQDPAIVGQELKLADQERRMAEQERKIAEQEQRLNEASRSNANGDQTYDRKQAEQERKIAELERNLAEASRSDSNGGQENNDKQAEQERRKAELERNLAEANRMNVLKDEPESGSGAVNNRLEMTGIQPTVQSAMEEDSSEPSDFPHGPPPSRKKTTRAAAESARASEENEIDIRDSEVDYESWTRDQGEHSRDEESELERLNLESPRTTRRIQPERQPQNSLPDNAARERSFDVKEEPASDGHDWRGSPVFDEYFELMDLAREQDTDVSAPMAPVDLNLMASLVRWASIAKHRVGEERLSAILDLYFQSRLLSPGLRELLNRISQMADELPPNDDQTSQVCADLISHLHGILTGGAPLGQIAHGAAIGKD